MRPSLVLVPPDLDPLDGLFVRDATAARLRLRVAAAVAAARERGAALLADLGTSGLDAQETAARARRRDVAAALVVGGPGDRAACRALVAALRASDVPTEAVLDEPPGAGGRAVERFVRTYGDAADGRFGAPHPFPDPAPGPLVRRGDEEAVCALLVDEPPGDEVARVARRAARAGATRVRLALEPGPAIVPDDAPGFAAARLLGRGDLRARIEAVVREALPHACYAFARAVAWADAGLDPFVAAYAGDAAAAREAASAFAPDDVEDVCDAFPALRPFIAALTGTGASAALAAAAATPGGLVLVRPSRGLGGPFVYEAVDGAPSVRPAESAALIAPLLDGPELASACAARRLEALGPESGCAPILLRANGDGRPSLVVAPSHGADAWVRWATLLRPDRAAAVRAAVATRSAAPL